MATRIDVNTARERALRGEAVLVCAYRDEDKCEKLRLDGALTLQELEDRQDELVDQEIIFYCA